MAFTYADLKADLENRLQNQFSGVTNPRVAINTAARELFMDVDVHTSIRHTQGVGTIYNNIFRYPLPTDIKGEQILDIVKTNEKVFASNVEYKQVPIEQYNRNFRLNTYAIDYHNSLKWLIGKFENDTVRILIHEMDGITTNGTWAVADDGTNLRVNTVNYITGSSSLSYDITASNTVMSIQNSTFTAVDLSDLEDLGRLFAWVFLPETTNLTNMTLAWGSDTSNFWSNTATSPFNTDSFEIGWNLVAFDWDGATETLSPNAAAIDFLKFTLTWSSTPTDRTGYLVDTIQAGLGQGIEYIYYSAFPWRTNNATWIQDSTTDTDFLNVDSEGYQLIVEKASLNLARSIPMSTEQIRYMSDRYETLKREYERKYPSQRKRIISTYYDMENMNDSGRFNNQELV